MCGTRDPQGGGGDEEARGPSRRHLEVRPGGSEIMRRSTGAGPLSAVGKATRRTPFIGGRFDERRSSAVQLSDAVRRSTAAVTATSIVTLPKVRKMSGIISTAISKASGPERNAECDADRRDRADEADLAGQADGAEAHQHGDEDGGDGLRQARLLAPSIRRCRTGRPGSSPGRWRGTMPPPSAG